MRKKKKKSKIFVAADGCRMEETKSKNKKVEDEENHKITSTC